MDRTEDMWDLTPNEISSRIKSERARRSLMDHMAWISARYIMLCVHCPEKMPSAPVFFPPEREDMTAEEMKALMRRMKGATPVDA